MPVEHRVEVLQMPVELAGEFVENPSLRLYGSANGFAGLLQHGMGRRFDHFAVHVRR